MQLGQHAGDLDRGVAKVQRRVVQRVGVPHRALVDVEGVDMAGVRGDAAQAAALPGADLDRDPGLQLGEQALEREALAELHHPVCLGGDGCLVKAGHRVGVTLSTSLVMGAAGIGSAVR